MSILTDDCICCCCCCCCCWAADVLLPLCGQCRQGVTFSLVSKLLSCQAKCKQGKWYPHLQWPLGTCRGNLSIRYWKMRNQSLLQHFGITSAVLHQLSRKNGNLISIWKRVDRIKLLNKLNGWLTSGALLLVSGLCVVLLPIFETSSVLNSKCWKLSGDVLDVVLPWWIMGNQSVVRPHADACCSLSGMSLMFQIQIPCIKLQLQDIYMTNQINFLMKMLFMGFHKCW